MLNINIRDSAARVTEEALLQAMRDAAPVLKRAQAGEESRNQQEDYGNRPLRAARYANA